jgi:hypothetical protein
MAKGKSFTRKILSQNRYANSPAGEFAQINSFKSREERQANTRCFLNVCATVHSAACENIAEDERS